MGKHQVSDDDAPLLRLQLREDAASTPVDNSEFHHHSGQEAPPT